MRFSIVTPAPINLGGLRNNLVISPDGTQIVYHSLDRTFNVRAMDQLVGAPLRGAEGVNPFFSPDSEWVGFVPGFPNLQDVSMPLQKVSLARGAPVTVTQSPNPIFGASWGADDQIVFGTQYSGLFRVSGGGGEPEALTTLDPEQQEAAHVWPFIIPDQEAVLFVIFFGGGNPTELAVLDLDTREVKRLGIEGASPHYVSTGHLVYGARDGSVRAVPFDAGSLEVTGTPVSLVEGVSVKGTGVAAFSISDNGRLVYALGGGTTSGPLSGWTVTDARNRSRLTQGVSRSSICRPMGRVAVSVSGADPSVRVYDLIQGFETRLTFESDAVRAGFPTWTPDGTFVAFGEPLSWKRADGTGVVETLGDDPRRVVPQAFSPDGTTLVFRDRTGTNADLGMLTLEGDRTFTLLLDEEYVERHAALSPDGRWLAYTSYETGEPEVYVRPFPDVGGGGQWQVSTDGGWWPVWNPSGIELFYSGPGFVMAREFETNPTFTPGALTQLFARDTEPENRRMAVSPDGQRFLFLASGDSERNTAREINVVVNWFQELTERVPVP